MGFCYTQLYDVEQEVNGLYTYDREDKFDDCSEIIAANRKKRLLRNSAGTVAAAGQSARKRGLGRPQGRQRAPQAQPRVRPRRKKRRRDRAWLVRKGCGRKARGDGVCRHGRRPGGGAGGSHGARRAQKSIVSPSAGFS